MAAMLGKEYGDLVWVISDKDHEVVGTSFDPDVAKKGNEELESWLIRSLNPSINIRFYTVYVAEHHIVVLKIPSAFRYPFSSQKLWESFPRKNLHDYLVAHHRRSSAGFCWRSLRKIDLSRKTQHDAGMLPDLEICCLLVILKKWVR